MGSLTERNPSLWVATSEQPQYPSLTGDLTAEAVVVGSGITGLTTALLLARAGVDVVVVEAGEVSSGVTAYTTAKVTSLHGLVYAGLIDTFDEHRARLYGEANQAAVDTVADLVATLEIDCDFERQAAYTYAETDENVPSIEAEVEAARRLGLPASLTTETTLPYPVKAAIRFDDQAQFHPRKYCLGLAAAIVASGGRVVARTRALHVADGDPCVVHTDRGEIRARHVVMATHLPFTDTGGYFARCAPYRSYALSVR